MAVTAITAAMVGRRAGSATAAVAGPVSLVVPAASVAVAGCSWAMVAMVVRVRLLSLSVLLVVLAGRVKAKAAAG